MQGPNFSLFGRVAAVTGASRGIGKSVACALPSVGATVALMGREGCKLADTHRELAADGCSVAPFCVDVENIKSIDAAFEKIRTSMDRIDILINNAGIEQGLTRALATGWATKGIRVNGYCSDLHNGPNTLCGRRLFGIDLTLLPAP